jgi:hypothetical protein
MYSTWAVGQTAMRNSDADGCPRRSRKAHTKRKTNAKHRMARPWHHDARSTRPRLRYAQGVVEGRQSMTWTLTLQILLVFLRSLKILRYLGMVSQANF